MISNLISRSIDYFVCQLEFGPISDLGLSLVTFTLHLVATSKNASEGGVHSMADVPLATATIALADVFKDEADTWLSLVLPATLIAQHQDGAESSHLAASPFSCASLLVRASPASVPVPTEDILKSTLQAHKSEALSNGRDLKEVLLPWEGELCLFGGAESDGADDTAASAAASVGRQLVNGSEEHIVQGYDPLTKPWITEATNEFHGVAGGEATSLADQANCSNQPAHTSDMLVKKRTNERLNPLRTPAKVSSSISSSTPAPWRDQAPVSGLTRGSSSGPGLLFVTLQPPVLPQLPEHILVLEESCLQPLSKGKRSRDRSLDRRWTEVGRCLCLSPETNLSPAPGLHSDGEAFVAGVDWSLKRPVVPFLRLRAMISGDKDQTLGSGAIDDGTDKRTEGMSSPVEVVGPLIWPGHPMHLSVQLLGCNVAIRLCFLSLAALPSIWQRKCNDLLDAKTHVRSNSEDENDKMNWAVPPLPSRIERPLHQSTAICLRVAHFSVLRPPTIPPHHRLRLAASFDTSFTTDATQDASKENSECCSLTLEPSSNTSALWVSGQFLNAAPVLQVPRDGIDGTPTLHLNLWLEPISGSGAHEEGTPRHHATFALPAEEEQYPPRKVVTLVGSVKLPLPEELLSGGRPFDSWLPLSSASIAPRKVAECRIALHAWSSRTTNPPVRPTLKEVASAAPSGYLRVVVAGGRGLRPVGHLSHSDSFVSLTLLPHGQAQPSSEEASAMPKQQKMAVHTPVATNGGDSPSLRSVLYLPLPSESQQSLKNFSDAHHVVKARVLSACIASSDSMAEDSSGGSATMGEVNIQVPWFVLPPSLQPPSLRNSNISHSFGARCFRGWHALSKPHRPQDRGCGELELEIDFVAVLDCTEKQCMGVNATPCAAPSAFLLDASPHPNLLGIALNGGVSTASASPAPTKLLSCHSSAELSNSVVPRAPASPLKTLSEQGTTLLASGEVDQLEKPSLAPILRLRDAGPWGLNESSDIRQGVCLLEWRPNREIFTGSAAVKTDKKGQPGASLATVGEVDSQLVLRMASSSVLDSAIWFESLKSSSSTNNLGRLGLDAARAMPGSRLNAIIETRPRMEEGGDDLHGSSDSTTSLFEGSSCTVAWLPLSMKGTLKLKLLTLKTNAGCLANHSLLGAKGTRKLRLRARTAIGGALAFSQRMHPLTRNIFEAALDFNGDEIGLVIDAAAEFRTCELRREKATSIPREAPDEGANQGVCPQAVVEISALDQTTGAFDNWSGSGDLALAPLLAAAARAASRGMSSPSRPAVLQVPLRPRGKSTNASTAATMKGLSGDEDVSAWVTVAATFEPTTDCLEDFWRTAHARPSIREANSVRSRGVTDGAPIEDEAKGISSEDHRTAILCEADWCLRSAFFGALSRNATSDNSKEVKSASTAISEAAQRQEPHVLVPALEAQLSELFPPLPPRVDLANPSAPNQALSKWRQHITALFGLTTATPPPSLSVQRVAWNTAAAMTGMLPSMLSTLRSMANRSSQADTSDDSCVILFSDYDAILSAAFVPLASTSLLDGPDVSSEGIDASSSPSRVIRFSPSTLARFAARRRADLARNLWFPPSENSTIGHTARKSITGTAKGDNSTEMGFDATSTQNSERAGLVAELRGLRRRLKSLDSVKFRSANPQAQASISSPTSRLAPEFEQLDALEETGNSEERLVLRSHDEVSESLIIADPPNNALALIPQPAREQALVAFGNPTQASSTDRWSGEQADLEAEVTHLQQQCAKLDSDRRKAALVADLALTRSSDIQARLEHASDATAAAAREREAIESELHRAQTQLSITSTAKARKKAREEAVVLFLRPEIEAMSAESKARKAASLAREARATLLQSSTRRWLAKRREEKETQAAHVLGSALRRLMRRAKLHLATKQRHTAAIHVQRLCRGRRVRRQLPLLLHLLPKLQARFRARRLREGRSSDVWSASSTSNNRSSAGLSPLALKRKEKTDQAAAARDRAERLVRKMRDIFNQKRGSINRTPFMFAFLYSA